MGGGWNAFEQGFIYLLKCSSLSAAPSKVYSVGWGDAERIVLF